MWAERYKELFRAYKVKHMNFRYLYLWERLLCKQNGRRFRGEYILVPIYSDKHKSADQSVSQMDLVLVSNVAILSFATLEK